MSVDPSQAPLDFGSNNLQQARLAAAQSGETTSLLSDGWGVASNNATGTTVGVLADMVQNGFTHYASAGPSKLAGTLGDWGENSARLSKGAGATSGLFSLFGLLGGSQQMGQGLNELSKGNLGDGLINTTAGAGSALSGGAGLMTLLPGVLGEAAIGGTGALGLGTTVASAGAVPIVATVGAGFAAGTAIGQGGNHYASKHRLLGDNRDGTGRDWSDLAADTGVDARQQALDAGAPELAADILGFGATAATSILSVPGAAITGVADIATGAYDLAGDGYSALMGADEDAIGFGFDAIVEERQRQLDESAYQGKRTRGP